MRVEEKVMRIPLNSRVNVVQSAHRGRAAAFEEAVYPIVRHTLEDTL